MQGPDLLPCIPHPMYVSVRNSVQSLPHRAKSASTFYLVSQSRRSIGSFPWGPAKSAGPIATSRRIVLVLNVTVSLRSTNYVQFTPFQPWRPEHISSKVTPWKFNCFMDYAAPMGSFPEGPVIAWVIAPIAASFTSTSHALVDCFFSFLEWAYVDFFL
jgi:hypothetical protein